MPRSLTRLAALLPLLILLLAPSAHATSVSVEIVTQVTSNPLFILGPQAGLFTPGETVEIRLTYDTMAVDTSPTAGVGTFLSAVSQLDVSFQTSGLSFQFGNPMSSIGTSDGIPVNTDSVAFTSASRLGGDMPGGVPAAISVQFIQQGGPGDLVVNDRPVPGPFSFTSATFDLNTTGIGATNMLLDGGTATALPEPGVFALMSLAALAVRRRSRT